MQPTPLSPFAAAMMRPLYVLRASNLSSDHQFAIDSVASLITRNGRQASVPDEKAAALAYCAERQSYHAELASGYRMHPAEPENAIEAAEHEQLVTSFAQAAAAIMTTTAAAPSA